LKVLQNLAEDRNLHFIQAIAKIDLSNHNSSSYDSVSKIEL